MAGDVDPLEQLGAEARELEKDAGAETREQAGAAAEAAGAPDSQQREAQGAAGSAPDAEVIQNPAQHIAAALTLARDVPFLKALLPPAVIGALDDATIAELAGALGDLAVKYRWDFTPTFGRWKEELRALMVLGTVGVRVYQAMQGDSEAGRAARATDVSPGAPGAAQADPPNAAAGKKPVEPGA